MNKSKQKIYAKQPDALFERVLSILEQAQGNVVRAVNTNMVLAYWLIGREIVQELQGGEERAAYGKQVVEELSTLLTERYGKGFSSPVLWSYRQFYLVYSNRDKILFPPGRESGFAGNLFPTGRELPLLQKSYPPGSESLQGFSPQLSWSHYRALMRIDNTEARHFYEREAVAGGWDKRTLERLIDLKVGELTHADVGQIDGYVRMFDGLVAAEDDNPTIGLILCTEKNETVARYSVLNDRKQIFASKYMLCLPTEEQLRLEIERERRLIESALEYRADE